MSFGRTPSDQQKQPEVLSQTVDKGEDDLVTAWMEIVKNYLGDYPTIL